MNLSHDDLEPGPMPPPVSADLGFLDHMDLPEVDLAPGFWQAVPAFSPVDDDESSRRAGGVAAPLARGFWIRTGVLSVAFFLLVLAGAAASALVFADRFGRLIAQ